MNSGKRGIPPRKRAYSSERHTQPPTPPPAVNEPNLINRLAYNVNAEDAKTIKSMIKAGRRAESAKIILTGTTVGLLMSFRNWEQVAKHTQWISGNRITHQLIKSIQVSCGVTTPGSFTRNQAMRILTKKVADQRVTDEDANRDSEPEDDQPDFEYPYFHDYFNYGVYCPLCGGKHYTVLPVD